MSVHGQDQEKEAPLKTEPILRKQTIISCHIVEQTPAIAQGVLPPLIRLGPASNLLCGVLFIFSFWHKMASSLIDNRHYTWAFYRVVQELSCDKK